MAGAPLKRGEALVWLPARRDAAAVLERGEAGLLAWRAAEGPVPVRVERVSFEGLQGTHQVTLIVDPRDVTVLTPQLPPLSGARLQQALPNVVEDSLLQDVAACAVVPGPVLPDGRRCVAVIDRAWLETAVAAFEQRGMRVRAAWPASLALPQPAGRWSLACLQDVLTIRVTQGEGYGWTAGSTSAARAAALIAALEVALAAHERPAGLSVWIDDAAWSEPLQTACDTLQLGAEIAPWHRLSESQGALNLLAGRASAGRRMWAAFDARAWRWPAGLAAACVGVSLLGLNGHWAQLSHEKAQLQRAMDARFRAAFPEAQVVVDPVLQMSRQLTALRARAGQRAADDGLPLLARLAQGLGPAGVDAVAAIEYREGRLTVRFQPAALAAPEARARVQDGCARVGLSVQFDSEREPVARIGLRG